VTWENGRADVAYEPEAILVVLVTAGAGR